MSLFLQFILLFSLQALIAGYRLQVSGTDFILNTKKVFLSGGSLPWINYGYDFGNEQWDKIKWDVNWQMAQLKQAGGNTMRLWVHVQGQSTPLFNSSGYVIATDEYGTFMDDFQSMLSFAQNNSIMVVPTLWNAATNQDDYGRLQGLIKDWRKLQTYIDVVLKPLVTMVKGNPYIAAWDILNEPEGWLIPGQHDNNPCFDTTKLLKSGAGFAGERFTYPYLLRFINWCADAIKSIDPGALVTNGIWNPMAGIDILGMVNHYKDECLLQAGERELGTLDFYEFHDYSQKGKFDQYSTFKHANSDYQADKPIVVGEFWAKNGSGLSDTQLFDHIYGNEYAGAWSWDLMGHGDHQRPAMTNIKYSMSNGDINFNV